jgi:uncharacterized integral membrane protein
MRFQGVLAALVVLLGIIFTVLNWPELITRQPVKLIFTQTQWSLGIVLVVIAVGLSVLFFVLSLADQAAQLRRVNRFQRQQESLQGALERKRLAEVEALEQTLLDRLGTLEQTLAKDDEQLQTALRGDLEEHRQGWAEHAEKLEQRLLLLRNELAADIAQVDDTLKHKLASDG